MILVLCVDDCLGMSFNGRRQSRDKAVYSDLAAAAGAAPIWVHPRSAALFEDTAGDIRAHDSFYESCGSGEYCFLEFSAPAALEAKAEKIILYRWNRRYPSDMKFDIDLGHWHQEAACDFPGSSHEKITKEVYVRE